MESKFTEIATQDLTLMEPTFSKGSRVPGHVQTHEFGSYSISFSDSYRDFPCHAFHFLWPRHTSQER